MSGACPRPRTLSRHRSAAFLSPPTASRYRSAAFPSPPTASRYRSAAFPSPPTASRYRSAAFPSPPTASRYRSAAFPSSPTASRYRSADSTRELLRLLGIAHIGGSHVFQHLAQVFVRLPAGHGQVVEQPVAAVLRSGAGHFAVILGDEAERVLHEQ